MKATTGGGPEREDDHRAGRVTLEPSLALLAVAVIGALVVAIASDGLRLVPPPLDPGPVWTGWIRAAGVLAAAAGTAGLHVFRVRWRAGAEGGADPTVVGVRTAAVLMGVLTMAALTLGPRRIIRGTDGTQRGASPLEWADWGGLDGGSAEPETPTRGGSSVIRGSGVQRGGPELPVVVAPAREPGGATLRERLTTLVGLLLLSAAAVWTIRHLRRRFEPPPDEASDAPVAAPDAETGLARSLDEVERPGLDPTGRITAAYRTLLRALADAGAPRAPHEAPHEHLHRALGPLGVRLEPLDRLASLYVLAHFSGRTVTDDDRAVAAAALQEGLDDLRAAGLRAR